LLAGIAHLQVDFSAPFYRFLVALGIPSVGKHTAQLIAKACGGSLDRFLAMTDTPGILSQEKGIGETVEAGILAWRQDPFRQAELNALLVAGLQYSSHVDGLARVTPTETIDSPLQGKRIVFTGTLETGTRAALSSRAEALGATVDKSVTKATDMLVCGTKSRVGNDTKERRAKELGLLVTGEQEFVDLLSGSVKITV
jgi:DNA ligase (NAD+)